MDKNHKICFSFSCYLHKPPKNCFWIFISLDKVPISLFHSLLLLLIFVSVITETPLLACIITALFDFVCKLLYDPPDLLHALSLFCQIPLYLLKQLQLWKFPVNGCKHFLSSFPNSIILLGHGVARFRRLTWSHGFFPHNLKVQVNEGFQFLQAAVAPLINECLQASRLRDPPKSPLYQCRMAEWLHTDQILFYTCLVLCLRWNQMRCFKSAWDGIHVTLPVHSQVVVRSRRWDMLSHFWQPQYLFARKRREYIGHEVILVHNDASSQLCGSSCW